MSVSPWQAAVLGAVEGLTEYLPVSSTGHLILASRWLGLDGEGVDTFDIVIQAGAIAAVLGLYRGRVAEIWRGLRGRSAEGRALLARLLASFLPAAVIGVGLRNAIKQHLFDVWPVVAALVAGGIVMIVTAPSFRRAAGAGKTLEQMTARDAVVIGLAQCLAMWPGTSRSMVTILAGLFLGFRATAAAEYSFLLALPTLGAATALDALKGGDTLIAEVGAVSLAIGFATAALVAAWAVRGFVRYLTRWGLAPFGWYRLGLAAAVWWGMR
jgi:undecaprenyl-diphosphatase